MTGPRSKGTARAARVELGFRIATSAIFVVAGIGHIVRPDEMVQRAADAPVGAYLAAHVPLRAFVLGTGAVLAIGGLSLAMGAWTRWSASILASMLVPITIATHVGHGGDPGPLLKNIALLGALAHFIEHGSGRLSLDEGKRRRGRDAPEPFG